MKLLTLGNPKAGKSKKLGYLTGVLHLAPAKLSGRNVCPHASPGCIRTCLNRSGRGGLTVAQAARKRRTLLYFNNEPAFMAHLRSDIYTLIDDAEKQNLKPACRLNGTSDIPEIPIGIAPEFPEVMFYDYTKNFQTLLDGTASIPNYHLTFSLSEKNKNEAHQALELGYNVAVPFAGPLPSEFMGRPVVDGDEHDLTFLHPKGVIVGLSPKGKLAKQDTSGFIVRL